MNAEQEITTYQKLRARRVNFDWLWQKVSDFTIPRRGDFVVTRYPGQRRDYNIYDSTAPWALDQFAAGLHSLLTSQALPWFYLRLRNQWKSKTPAVMAWLQDTESRINSVFNDPDSRFQSQVHEYYLDIGAFGTAVMYVEDDKGIKFSTRFLGECYIKQTHYGVVDTIYRAFMLSKEEAENMLGPNLGPAIAREKDPQRMFPFLHCVKPDGEAWESCYISLTDSYVVREGSYDSFPFMVARWEKTAYEDYGRSPAINCLSEILSVNKIRMTLLRQQEKAVDPPVLIPSDGFLQPINLNPGQPITYDQNVQGGREAIGFLESKAKFDVGNMALEGSQNAITRSFYVDMLQLPGGLMPGAKNQNTYMTATEASIRRENAMRVLGPMVARMQTEFLSPLIMRVYDILKQRRSLAPPPPGVKGESIDIEYVSPLAIAQKAAEGDNFLRMIQLLNPVIQAKPEVLDALNGDELVRFAARIYRTPAELVYSDEQLQQIRAQRAQAAQQQAQAENGPTPAIQENPNLINLKRNMEAANSVGDLMQKMRA